MWDGPHSIKTRRELYPEYKAGRPPLSDDITGAFALIQEVLPHTNGISIKVPGYEADDVIAQMINKYAGQHTISLHSTDRDFWQLSPYPNLQFEYHSDLHPEDVCLYKTLVGDKSDNIPGAKGFGEKSWLMLDYREKYLLNNIMRGDDDSISMLKDWTPEYWRKAKTAVRILGEDLEQLRIFYRIVRFFHVDQQLINDHTVAGSPNPAKKEEILGRFFQ